MENPSVWRWYVLTLVAPGIFASVLGVIALSGWYFHSQVLVEVLPGLPAIPYWAALSLFLCGIGMLASAAGRPNLAVLLGFSVIFLSVFLLIESSAALNLGLTKVLQWQGITPLSNHFVSHIPHHTAAVFMLTGIALFIVSSPRRLDVGGFILGIIGVLISTLGLLTWVGYLIDVPIAVGWSAQGSASPQVALAFIAIGVGFTAYVWHKNRVETSGITKWPPVIVVTAIVVITLLLWQALLDRERDNIAQILDLKALTIKKALVADVQYRFFSLERLAKRMQMSEDITKERWEREARLYFKEDVGYQAIEWVDSNLFVRWVVPHVGNELDQDFNLTQDSARYAAVKAAQRVGDISTTHFTKLRQGVLGMSMVAPVFRGNEFKGAVIGILGSQPFFDAILHEQQSMVPFSIMISEGSKVIYQRFYLGSAYEPRWARNISIVVDGYIDWSARIWFDQKQLGKLRSSLPAQALVTGLLIALLLAIMFWVMNILERRSREIRAINHDLSIEVTKRKKAELSLQDYAKKLESSNQELQQFAYIASHDLQEPLRKIKTFSSFLIDQHAEQLPEEGRDYLQRIVGAVTRMQTLITGLLHYSRVTRAQASFVVVDLAECLKGVLSDLEMQLHDSGGQVEVLTDLPTLCADPLQIRQLLQNLISNALKFRKKDVAPVVKISAEMITENGARYCQITVEDNGIGFDEKYANRIFGVFQRLHGRDEYPGTGIGLAVCQKVVEHHGGKIIAKGRPDHGAKFIITLAAQLECEITPLPSPRKG